MEHSGIIILNKPSGISSHKCVSIARKALNMKKIGHTGTLDPLASGVLPILIGSATKASDFLLEKDKRYRAKVLLGTTTDTLDITGTVTSSGSVSVTEEDVRKAVSSFIGDIEQIPPMYSAISYNGQRLYSLARQGIDIERKARPVTIYSIDIIEISLPYITLDVHSSKGTYIRSLASDIGDKLGCGGCISELSRTASGVYSIENSVTPEELLSLSENGNIEDVILPLDSIFSGYEKITLDKKRADRVKNGVPIYYKGKTLGQIYRIYDENDVFIALSQADITDSRECLKLIKGFYK